jgi:hypothetical protein
MKEQDRHHHGLRSPLVESRQQIDLRRGRKDERAKDKIHRERLLADRLHGPSLQFQLHYASDLWSARVVTEAPPRPARTGID